MSEPTWNESPETRVAELVRRLRSGEYEQGRGYLRLGNKFCCLGVACDMATEVGVTQVAPDEGELEVKYVGPSSTYMSALPPQVHDWLGFEDGFGVTEIPLYGNGTDEIHTLASLNDEGLTFDQIADVIEAGLVRTND